MISIFHAITKEQKWKFYWSFISIIEKSSEINSSVCKGFSIRKTIACVTEHLISYSAKVAKENIIHEWKNALKKAFQWKARQTFPEKNNNSLILRSLLHFACSYVLCTCHIFAQIYLFVSQLFFDPAVSRTPMSQS